MLAGPRGLYRDANLGTSAGQTRRTAWSGDDLRDGELEDVEGPGALERGDEPVDAGLVDHRPDGAEAGGCVAVGAFIDGTAASPLAGSASATLSLISTLERAVAAPTSSVSRSSMAW